MWDILGNWINAILTIAIISFAVPGENIFYRIAEYIMIGITAGYAVVQGMRVVLNLGISPMMSGQAYMLFPILLGLLVYTRFSKQYGYLSRWPIALMVGSGIGVSIRAVPEVDIMNQIKASFLPLVGVNWDVAVSNIILLIALLSTLFYFFMTVEQKGPLRQILRRRQVQPDDTLRRLLGQPAHDEVDDVHRQDVVPDKGLPLPDAGTRLKPLFHLFSIIDPRIHYPTCEGQEKTLI